jgi:hypothetical protein
MNTPLFDKNKLLDKLTAETKPLWGKMSAQHMIEHLILAVKISNGKIKVDCFNPPEKIPTLKRFLISGRPLPKEFINPYIGVNLIPLEYSSLAEAINALGGEINDFYNYFKINPNSVLTNPTFGDLNKSEWDVFHEKHFTHHLSQFGLI